MKIAITTSSFARFSDAPLQLLRQEHIDYVLNPLGRKLTENETIDLLQDCVAVAAGTEPLTARVMDALPGLKVISRCGTGMDNVDMEAARARGIAVRNTPDGPTQAVAELTLGLALDLMRQVSRMDRELRSGVWKKRMGNLLGGKRLGIVGMGRIGRAVADIFTPLGVQVAFNDPVSCCGDYPCMPVEELLGWADILSLHCSMTGGECSLFTAEHLRRMKRGSWVINVARGGLIDEQALYEALADGHLAGAAVDVFGNEPYTGLLSSLDNVILTPHIGSYAKEARIRMETDTIANLIDALRAAGVK